jgi:hypothetical protein
MFLSGLALSEISTALNSFTYLNNRKFWPIIHFLLLIFPIYFFYSGVQIVYSIDKIYNKFLWQQDRQEVLRSGLGRTPAPWTPPMSFARLLFAINIILLLEFNSIARRVFNMRIFQILGKYSFSFYLLHPGI